MPHASPSAAPSGPPAAAAVDRPAVVRVPPGPAALLGGVGALGDELMSLLLAHAPPHPVHVAVNRPLQSSLAQFVPFVWPDPAGSDDPPARPPPGRAPGADAPDAGSWPAVDTAWLVVTPADAVVPRGAPLQRLALDSVPAAARAARQAGARTLVVVSPLAALLQMGGLAAGIGSADELALAGLGFERLVIVRPTDDPSAPQAGGDTPGLGHRIFRNAARAVRDIMLPHAVQPLSARSAAQAIATLVAAAPPGVRVLTARDLHAWIDVRSGAATARRRPWLGLPR